MKAGSLSGMAVVLLFGALPAVAQAGPQTASAQTAAAPAAKAAPAPAPSIERGKQRDPFHTMLPEKKGPEALPSHMPAGMKGLVIDQLELEGIAQGIDGKWIAIVNNKAKRAYFLHDKDQLYNGYVSKVLQDRIIFQQNVTESPTKTTTREVVKLLSPE